MELHTLLIIESIFYGVALAPSVFLVKRHGKPGYFGWGFVTLLCLMHIIGGAMQLTGTRYGLSVLNSCPAILLIACCGLWWEANHHLESLNKVAKAKAIVTSFITLLGTLLLATDCTLCGRTKYVIASICWGIAWLAATIQAIFSMKAQNFGLREPSQKLLVAATVGTICAGVRIIFTIAVKIRLVYRLGGRTFSTGVIFALVIFPEVVATICLIVIGLMTRNIGG